MGNKSKLLDFIIPEIQKITDKGDVVCDLMAGTCSIGYALKERNTIYTNDVQYYSYIISQAIIVNNKSISSELAEKMTYSAYQKNMSENIYKYFQLNYSDTYFSEPQCKEIDSVRFAIDQVQDEGIKALFMLALMSAMSTCESTPGHFAQYLNKDHQRLVPIRKMSIYNTFIAKCDDYANLISSSYSNKAFNEDANRFMESEDFDAVKCVYIDTPYTAEQYSRFYHVLETICKYDNPVLENNKGLYRNDRFMSEFSQNASVNNAFEKMIKLCAEKKKKIVVSYSNRGLVSVGELKSIIDKYYKNCEIKTKEYNHSTQGKGNIKIEEVLFIATEGR
ncbi:MAG: DNA adenine methylase [Clostridia bacterium]|nr:DNA adenine methylase [Clostridia bacterium]